MTNIKNLFLSLCLTLVVFLLNMVTVQAAGAAFGPGNCPAGDEYAACVACINAGGTWSSGLGCINTEPGGLFASIIRIALGVMGGVILIRFIIVGYQYQFGDEAKLKEARDAAFSTLGGVIFLVFSVLILKIIGENILGVVPPGFFG
jgi:hypothetical protein